MPALNTSPKPLALNWLRCTDGKWCPLTRLNLSSVNSMGVYIIFYIDQNNVVKIVRVGQGEVASRLAEHRENQEILKYGVNRELMVTWADVPSKQIGGVEAYLGDMLKPLVGERFPNIPHIPVNFPFG